MCRGGGGSKLLVACSFPFRFRVLHFGSSAQNVLWAHEELDDLYKVLLKS